MRSFRSSYNRIHKKKDVDVERGSSRGALPEEQVKF